MNDKLAILELSKCIWTLDDLTRKSGLRIATGDNFDEYVRITNGLPRKAADRSTLPSGLFRSLT
ncbi:hypothetical protein NKH85_33480 [Mesorhizobium sp. M0924]|uniref:hypothetical protein n=1 Tax=unclassified Mesorhizobium TaxID=325217 RepID=UPI00333802F2